MSFIRSKEIPPGSGRWYDYEVESVRQGDKVIQKHIRYIGKSGQHGPTSGAGGGGIGTTQSMPTSPVNIGTTSPRIGDYRYGVEGHTLRRGVVVNESWIGEGPNAVDWESGGINTNMGMTLSEAEDKLRELKHSEEAKSAQRDAQYQDQKTKLESAQIISPKSKILQSLGKQLSSRRLLTSGQMKVVNDVISRKPFRPPEPGTSRTIYRQGEKVTQYYVPKAGWVDKSEVHEYVEE